ncbi:flagellar hook-length control protein FliK [Aliidiomarina sp. Khilg15.8]
MQNILPASIELKGKQSLNNSSGPSTTANGSFATELGRIGQRDAVNSDQSAGVKTAILAATDKALEADDSSRSAEDWLALVEKARAGDAKDVENLQQALQSMQEDGGLSDLVEDMKSQLSAVLSELEALIDAKSKSDDDSITEMASQANALTEALLVLTQGSQIVDRDGTKPVMGYEPLQQTLQKQVEVLDGLQKELDAEHSKVVQPLPQKEADLIAMLKELGIKAAQDEDSESQLKGLLSELSALLEESDADGLVAVDGAELKEKLSSLLDNIELQGEPLTAKEKRDVLTLLQAQLDAMQADDDEATANAMAEPQQAAIQQLLAQLNSLLEAEQGEVRLAQPEQRGGNVLPPVLQALAKAAAQLRNEAQASAAAAAAEGAADEDSQLAAEGFRRLFNELNSQTAGNESKANTSQQALTTNANQAPVTGAREGAAAATQARNAQEAAMQSSQENARQLQQAVDILGPQAPQQLRERIAVMFNSRTQAAEIRLDPPDLGRMQIRVNLNQEQASINFQVSNPQAREALEQSMPRLRELLAENGIQLADSNVSEQKSGGEGSAGTGSDGFAGNGEADGVEAELTEQTTVEVNTGNADGRIDYYA